LEEVFESVVWVLEDEAANFDAAAGIYVDPDNRMHLWSSQHGMVWVPNGDRYTNVMEFGPAGSPPISLADPPLTVFGAGGKAVEIVIDGVEYTVRLGKKTGITIWRGTKKVGGYVKEGTVWVWDNTFGRIPFFLADAEMAGAEIQASSAVTIGTTLYYTATLVDSEGNAGPPTEVFSVTVGLVPLAIPDAYGAAGQSVRVPVQAANAEGLQMCDVDLRLTYDPAVLVPTGVTETPLTAGYQWASQVISPGLIQAVISTTTGPTMHGGGAILEMAFDVIGQEGNSSDVGFEVAGSRFVDCEYPSTPLLLDLSDTAVFAVQAGHALGDVDGDGDVDQADAGLVLQIAVGAVEPSAEQSAAGDLNGDGRLNAADAVVIMRLAAGLPLVPVSAQMASPAAVPTGPVNLSVPSYVAVPQGGSVWVPLTIDDALGLAGFDARLSYDPYVISAVEVRTTDLSANYDLAFHEPVAGQVRISLKPKVGYEDGLPGGSGPLVEVRFEDRDLTQGNAMTLLNPVAVRLSDPYGRDFANSALQVEIGVSEGTLAVEDVTPPRVAATYPFEDGFLVEPDEPIYVLFSEAMSLTTLVLDVTPGLGFSQAWNEFGTELVLDHAGLAEETEYTVSVMAEDLAGIPMTQTVTWSFTTTVADHTLPTVLSVSPPDGAAEVEQNTPIVITFSEEVYVPNLLLTLKAPPSGEVHRLDVTANMTVTVVSATLPSLSPVQATCILTVTAEDRAGNPMAAPYSWSFRRVTEGHRIYLPLVLRQ
jgi:hypothetical protein